MRACIRTAHQGPPPSLTSGEDQAQVAEHVALGAGWVVERHASQLQLAPAPLRWHQREGAASCWHHETAANSRWQPCQAHTSVLGRRSSIAGVCTASWLGARLLCNGSEAAVGMRGGIRGVRARSGLRARCRGQAAAGRKLCGCHVLLAAQLRLALDDGKQHGCSCAAPLEDGQVGHGLRGGQSRAEQALLHMRRPRGKHAGRVCIARRSSCRGAALLCQAGAPRRAAPAHLPQGEAPQHAGHEHADDAPAVQGTPRHAARAVPQRQRVRAVEDQVGGAQGEPRQHALPLAHLPGGGGGGGSRLGCRGASPWAGRVGLPLGQAAHSSKQTVQPCTRGTSSGTSLPGAPPWWALPEPPRSP